MRLSELMCTSDYQLINGNMDIEIDQISVDSRCDCRNKVFVAIRGYRQDGHKHIGEAIENGAKAIICEDDIFCPPFATVLKVKNTKETLANISKKLYDSPDEKLIAIGITGTKGKTTTSFLVKEVLEASGIKTGILGTIIKNDGEISVDADNTTDSCYETYKWLNRMVDKGCKAVVMEVSSQGLKDYRVHGIDFNYGIFTNLTEDHIGKDEHESFQEYLECKSKLFAQCQRAIINADDPYGKEILKDFKGPVKTFGIRGMADYLASEIEFKRESTFLGVRFRFSRNGDENCNYYSCGFPGIFSVYNALAAVSLGIDMGLDHKAIKKGIRETRVAGRAQIIPYKGDALIIVDYAHNAVALENFLVELRKYDSGRLITVFGCGGNRDKNRRYEMGDVSGRLSDFTVITSDNPRREHPMAIIDDIAGAVEASGGEYTIIPDRRDAIHYAMEIAQKSDIILVAGKGHENYQIIGDIKYPMDDAKIIYQYAKDKS